MKHFRFSFVELRCYEAPWLRREHVRVGVNGSGRVQGEVPGCNNTEVCCVGRRADNVTGSLFGSVTRIAERRFRFSTKHNGLVSSAKKKKGFQKIIYDFFFCNSFMFYRCAKERKITDGSMLAS